MAFSVASRSSRVAASTLRVLRTSQLVPRALSTASQPTAQSHHFRMTKDESEDHFMNHPIYSKEEMDAVQVTQRPPESTSDKIAFYFMKTLRVGFDTATGYGKDMDEHKWLTRMIFLESVAGVPGMVGGMWRHFSALRSMRRDYGWIHTLLEEAENERMHLMTFLELRKPGPVFRALVLGAQGVFFNLFFVSYIFAPSMCHRFVGYLEEEAVYTYTKAIQQLEAGGLKSWEHMPASPLARKYWRLEDDAKWVDVLKAVRADEMVHREVNHTLASVGTDSPNPFAPHYMQQRDVSEHPNEKEALEIQQAAAAASPSAK